MNKKKITLNTLGGLVYSTNPDFNLEETSNEVTETLQPSQQKLKILLDKKQRAGKKVTLIEGFIGSQSDLEELGKKLKSFCGTGGAVKDGEIIIQGDNKDKALQWLQKNGYSSSKKI